MKLFRNIIKWSEISSQSLYKHSYLKITTLPKDWVIRSSFIRTCSKLFCNIFHSNFILPLFDIVIERSGYKVHVPAVCTYLFPYEALYFFHRVLRFIFIFGFYEFSQSREILCCQTNSHNK